MVDGLRDYKFYIEKYKDISVNISSTENSSNLLFVNSDGDYLNDECGGVRALKSCTSFPYSEKILLYNKSEYILIDGTFDNDVNDFRFYNKENVRYRLYADELSTTNLVTVGQTSKFEIDLTLYNVYKCFLNGNELLEYTYDKTGVYLSKKEKYLLNNYSDNTLNLVVYKKDQTVVGTTTFVFKGVNTINYVEMFDNCDFTVFDSMLYIDEFDEGFTTTQAKSLYTYKSKFEYVGTNIVNDIENKLSISMYCDGNEDLRLYIQNEWFRIIGINKKTKKLKIYNNCKISEGVGENISDLNKKTYNIDYEERIDINVNSPVAYNQGNYNEGYYNGISGYSDGEAI